MDRVVIGMDPHKRSATIEVCDQRERVLAGGRFGTDRAGYRQLLALGRGFPDRVWAVEGCEGVGRHLAQRLVADGEPVFDVPAKLSARIRVFSTGQGRKTDAGDAHAVALVGLRTPRLRRVTVDDQTVAVRLLIDRRDALGTARTQTVNRLHRLLGELISGGAGRSLTAARARKMLASVRPRGVAGRTRRRLAAELVADLSGIDRRISAADAELRELVRATGSSLLQMYGIGPCGAARIIADIGDVARFPSRGHFASWNGTAPIEVSSGEHTRHRLSRAGNRRINRVLHTMAIVQLRADTEGRAHYRRKRAAGKTRMEALRALKRRLSDQVYRQLVADQKHHRLAAAGTGPGGHLGAATGSSAADSHPSIDSSEKSLPGPAGREPTPVGHGRQDHHSPPFPPPDPRADRSRSQVQFA